MSNGKKQKKTGIKRRKFLKYTGVGLGLAAGITYFTRHQWRRVIFDLSESIVPPYAGSTKPNVWFHITPDNQVILHSSKVEMGQGIFTGLAQIAADELDVDIKNIKVVHAATASGNVDTFATGGSTTIASLWQPMREMAATLREMIKNEAASKWGVSADTLSTASGIVSGNGQSMSYGEAVSNVSKWKMPDVPQLRPTSEYRYIGKPVARVDLSDKVHGAPIFGIDASIPGMVYGSVVRPTMVDATLESCDTSKAKNLPGVIAVIVEKDFVGVVAESYMQADIARRALKPIWKTNKPWHLAEVRDMIQVGRGDPTVVQTEGDVSDHWDDGEYLEMIFDTPIGAHAQLEPNGALADYVDGKCTVHMSTQVVAITQKEIANRLGISTNDVNVIPTFLGGGFGRRLHTPNAIQAAVMSREVGRPVKCFFDRQQEFQNDTFRPPTQHIMKGKLDSNGKIVALEHNFASGDVMFGSALLPKIVQSTIGGDIGAIRGGSLMYTNIENRKSVSWRVKLPFATSWWRSLGLLANTFAIESMMDALAEKAGQSPVDFRLAHLDTNDKTSARIAKVIQVAAEKSGYTNEAINGKAMGIAASIDADSPCAHVAEVSIENGEIQVHKVTCAFDCGVVINPDQVRAQCEGNIIMGISASLYEKMDLQDSVLSPIIYGPYRMALMKNAPKEIDVHLVEGKDVPGTVGEPPLGPIAAAIANAVYRLTGERVTGIPFVGA